MLNMNAAACNVGSAPIQRAAKTRTKRPVENRSTSPAVARTRVTPQSARAGYLPRGFTPRAAVAKELPIGALQSYVGRPATLVFPEVPLGQVRINLNY